MATRPSFITMLFVNSMTIGSGIPFFAISIYYISNWTALRSELADPSSTTHHSVVVDRRTPPAALAIIEETPVSAHEQHHDVRSRTQVSRPFDWRAFSAGCLLGAILTAGTVALVTWTHDLGLTAREKQSYDYRLSQGKARTACDAYIRLLRNEYDAK